MIFVIELGVIDRFFNGFKELRQCRRLFIADRKFRSKWNRSQIPHSFLLSNDIFNVPLYFSNLNKSSPLYIFIRTCLVGISGYYNFWCSIFFFLLWRLYLWGPSNLATKFLTYWSLKIHNLLMCTDVQFSRKQVGFAIWTSDYGALSLNQKC